MLLFNIWIGAIFHLAHVVYLHAQELNADQFTYILDDGYPTGEELFGSIAGIDADKDNNIIIFHRGAHVWKSHTFDPVSNVYLLSRANPIRTETVVTINPSQNKIIRAWGKNRFFMPHGLSLDLDGKHLWLTDVAMHQVFKFTLDGSSELITLGTPFEPGNDETHFCKPTSVADTGEFVFVADGYCNARVVMFSAEGKYISEFGSEAPYSAVQPSFNIPHKIVYAKEAKMLCVADRERGRIQCFTFEPKQFIVPRADETRLILNGAIRKKYIIDDQQFNGRLFAIDYSPAFGGIIAAVSGEELLPDGKPPQGFVYNATTAKLISRFSPPPNRTFGMAHDLVITGSNANSIYVVDISPVNLWKFSRPSSMGQEQDRNTRSQITSDVGQALSMESQQQKTHTKWYLFAIPMIAFVLICLTKNGRSGESDLFAPLQPNGYSAGAQNMARSIYRRSIVRGANALSNTRFARRGFSSLFTRAQRQQSEFSRIPLDESDNSEEDKSDSDVEEFNINQASPKVKITV